jgi:hypothetical protein
VEGGIKGVFAVAICCFFTFPIWFAIHEHKREKRRRRGYLPRDGSAANPRPHDGRRKTKWVTLFYG